MPNRPQANGGPVRPEVAVVRLWTAVNADVISSVKNKFEFLDNRADLVDAALNWWKARYRERPRYPKTLINWIENHRNSPRELLCFQFAIVDPSSGELFYWSLTDDEFDRHKDKFSFPYNERHCLVGITIDKRHVKGFDGCTCAITPDKVGLGWCAATNNDLYIPDLRKYQEAELTAAPDTDYLWGVGSCIYLPISAGIKSSRDNRTDLGVLVIYSPIHNLFGTEHLISRRTEAPLPVGISNVNPNSTFFDVLRDIIDTEPLRDFILDLRQHHEALNAAVSENARAIATNIIGISEEIGILREKIARVALGESTVMITGESGTGKELVARALHFRGPRAGNCFVAINTAAMPKDLLETELFGHERGAFTGAQAMRRGRFEQAEGGTLFLDEIGDMPSDLQTRLLRVLSDGGFYRVGGHQLLQANVRVIAATHQDLEARVKEGLFRDDLFHRLNVIRLHVPPLRERVEDIPVLAAHFLRKWAREKGMEIKRLSEPAERHLRQMPWHGNVRELENRCESLTVLVPGMVVRPEDIVSVPALALGKESEPDGGQKMELDLAQSTSKSNGSPQTPTTELPTSTAEVNLSNNIKRLYQECSDQKECTLANGRSRHKQLKILLLDAMRGVEDEGQKIDATSLSNMLGKSTRNYLHGLLGHLGTSMPELKKTYRANATRKQFDIDE